MTASRCAGSRAFFAPAVGVTQPRGQTMTATPKLDKAELSRFTGTEHWYRHALNRDVLYTDGAKYVADVGGAHWLLDLIAVSQRYDERLSRQPFQVWGLAL